MARKFDGEERVTDPNPRIFFGGVFYSVFAITICVDVADYGKRDNLKAVCPVAISVPVQEQSRLWALVQSHFAAREIDSELKLKKNRYLGRPLLGRSGVKVLFCGAG